MNLNYRMNILYLLLLLLVTFLSSCSIFTGSADKDNQKKHLEEQSTSNSSSDYKKVEAENLENSKKRILSNIELVWKIPEQEVEGFIIEYGKDKDSLSVKEKILLQDIEKYQDKKHGLVYRHFLKEIPSGETIFVKIRAYLGEVISESSEIIEVRAKY